MCGLAINIASFVLLLKRMDFDAIVYHLTLTHIIKSKAELATPFNLYYIKGKDLICIDLLSRQSMMIAIHMKSYLVHSTCNEHFKLGIIF